MDHLEPIRLYYAFTYNVPIKKGANDGERRKYAKFIQTLCDQSFQFEVKNLSHEKIAERLDFHLRTFLRNGGEKADWVKHTKALIPANITLEQKDAFLNWIEQHEQDLIHDLTKNEQEQESQAENDFTRSTIEDWLCGFEEKMSEADYQNLVLALVQYFETGIFPTLANPIKINGRLNMKRVGWALNRIFEAKGKGVEKELLQFAKQNISLFADVQFDETNILNSRLYKYFTTKTE
jgi:hypothetical protein